MNTSKLRFWLWMVFIRIVHDLHQNNAALIRMACWWTLRIAYMAVIHGRAGRAFCLLDSCDGKLQKLATRPPHFVPFAYHITRPTKRCCWGCQVLSAYGGKWSELESIERLKESKLPHTFAIANKQDGFIFSRYITVWNCMHFFSLLCRKSSSWICFVKL